jgi:lysophospholipase L1-like esterase
VIGDVASADHDRVLALAADLGLPTIDMLPVFRTHPNPLSLFPYEEGRHLVKTQGLHYNAQGHRLVGIRIVDAIESLGGNGEGRH